MPRLRKQVCTRCKESKDVKEFGNDRSRNNGKFPWCRECVSWSRKQERAQRVVGEAGDRQCPICEVGLEGTHRNRLYCSLSCKDKARRFKTFGLTPDEYRQLTAVGKCPICLKNVKRWEIDHNHKTGETTGAVCRVCNGFLLAYTNHDPEIAKRLVTYLENPPVRVLFGERRYIGPENVSQLHRMWAWNPESE